MFWTSRLLAGAALGLFALEIYSAIELHRVSADSLTESERTTGFALRLIRVLPGPGVLLMFAAAIAVLGPRFAGGLTAQRP